MRRAGGDTDRWHGDTAVQVVQVWVNAAWTHGLWLCSLLVLFSKQKKVCKWGAKTSAGVLLTDPQCKITHQSLMSFLGTRQASQTAIMSTGGLFWGVSPLFLCFQFLGKCHQPCRNGGKCTGKNKCKCSKGYQGDLCSKRKYQSAQFVLAGAPSSHRTSSMTAARAACCQSISG